MHGLMRESEAPPRERDGNGIGCVYGYGCLLSTLPGITRLGWAYGYGVLELYSTRNYRMRQLGLSKETPCSVWTYLNSSGLKNLFNNLKHSAFGSFPHQIP